jgi:nitrogen fixation protein FixH
MTGWHFLAIVGLIFCVVLCLRQAVDLLVGWLTEGE